MNFIKKVIQKCNFLRNRDNKVEINPKNIIIGVVVHTMGVDVPLSPVMEEKFELDAQNNHRIEGITGFSSLFNNYITIHVHSIISIRSTFSASITPNYTKK